MENGVKRNRNGCGKPSQGQSKQDMMVAGSTVIVMEIEERFGVYFQFELKNPIPVIFVFNQVL